MLCLRLGGGRGLSQNVQHTVAVESKLWVFNVCSSSTTQT